MIKPPKEISRAEFEKIKSQKNLLIVDIREKEEFADFNCGGVNIPAHEISGHYENLGQYKKIVVLCSNGMRSSIIARVLSKKLPNTQVLHLTEGIL